ncbi:NAD(P)-binding protein [Camillea tinctor]|nr:NAD(P)-binding protein [Camillea tinctor]
MSSDTQFKGTILVTGGGGYLGAHIVGAALEKGYAVRLTARTPTSVSSAIAQHPAHYSSSGQLTGYTVADITSVEAFAAVFRPAGSPVSGIIHSASPFNLSPVSAEADLLVPAVQGSTAVLEAAVRYGGGEVSRVVATSSFAAVCDPARGRRPGYTYTEADWNPVTWEEAAAPGAPRGVAYAASKGLAERAMRTWLASQSPQPFTLTTLCPGWIFGPYLNSPVPSHPCESIRQLLLLLSPSPNPTSSPPLPPFDFALSADVTDVAQAHVRALEVEPASAVDARFILGTELRYGAAAQAARDAFPTIKGRFADPREGEAEEQKEGGVYAVDGSAAERVLGVRYTGLGETVVRTFEQVLGREREVKV